MSSILSTIDADAGTAPGTAPQTPTTGRRRPDGDRTRATRDRDRERRTARCIKRGHAVTRSGNVRRAG